MLMEVVSCTVPQPIITSTAQLSLSTTLLNKMLLYLCFYYKVGQIIIQGTTEITPTFGGVTARAVEGIQ